MVPLPGLEPLRIRAAVVDLPAVGGVNFEPEEAGRAVEGHVTPRRTHDRQHRAALLRPDPERERHLPARPVVAGQGQFEEIRLSVKPERIPGDSGFFRHRDGTGQDRFPVLAAQRLGPVEAPLHAGGGQRQHGGQRRQRFFHRIHRGGHSYRLQNSEKLIFSRSGFVAAGLNSSRVYDATCPSMNERLIRLPCL